MSTGYAAPNSLTRKGTEIRVTGVRVVRSELTKFRSLRSTVITLLVAVVLMIGIGAMFAAITASLPGGFDDGETAVSTSLSGTFFAQLAIGVLGVLLISGEYGTGSIRSSLTVVPRRLPVLWAKLTVFAAAVFGTMLIASVTAFFLGQALLREKEMDAALSDPGVLRSIVGAAMYLAVVGLIGIALGSLLRNTAAAISTVVVAFFVIAPLAMLLPASWAANFVQYLPSNAGAMLLGGTYGVAEPLAPWTGFAVMNLYAVLLIGFAGWRLQRHDV